ncbi:MAG: cellulose biosynthesis cyclic di-GMP-binding regulatory protein BcsB [Patulibacter sp.]
MTHPSRHLGRFALCLLVLLAIPATASAASQFVRFSTSDSAPVKLTGGVAQFQGAADIPRRWGSYQGTVKLGWGANPKLAASSALQITVDGRVVGTQTLDGTAGSASFTIPRRSISKDQTAVQVAVQARLRLRDEPCPSPDDLRAFVQLTASSGVELRGSWRDSAIRLSDLPDAAVTSVGAARSRLVVAFPSAPTPEMVGAAALAAGEISAVSGRGEIVQVSTPANPVRPGALDAVLRVTPTQSAAKIEVTAEGAAPTITLSGGAGQLLRAAGALRPSIARGLRGSAATNLPALTIVRKTLPRRLPLDAGSFSGFGKGTVTSSFTIPPWREALRGARLRLAVDYDAPAGGRVGVQVNGRNVDTEDLRSTGSPRFTVEEELAGRGPALQRGDLLAGNNSVQLQVQLAFPNHRCERPDEVGSVNLSQYGSVTLLTRARPALATLSVFPFPLDAQPGWKGATVQLPEQPTGDEIAAVIGTLAESRRLTGEAAAPTIRFSTDPPARGAALVLARPGAVPASLARSVTGPVDTGVLAAVSRGGSVQFLAVGPRALTPFSTNSATGIVQGRVAEVLSPSRVVVRVADAQRVTGVERGAASWRWPLIVIALALVVLAAVGLRGAVRRLRREENE